MDFQQPTNVPFQEPLIAIVQSVEQEPPEEKKPAKPITYRIKKGDTLIKIAKAHKTTWRRLYDANKGIKHPDQIKPSQVLRIPDKNEKLKKRSIIGVRSSVGDSLRSGGYSSSGNTYTRCQCTWGVKNWRPDIPNGWGDASSWMANAQAMGWPTGTEPRIGAVAWTLGHVAVVTSIQADTVTFKDMNGNWTPCAIGYRTIPKYSYRYIY